jgi:CubicO group peptidase (beta-lactamase class C family)
MHDLRLTRPALALVVTLSAGIACTSSDRGAGAAAKTDSAPARPAAAPARAPSSPTVLSTDTPVSTAEGATFVAPADWRLSARGPMTIVEAPEGDSRIVLVDVTAADADAAVAAAWAAYNPAAKWPLKVANDVPDQDGWTSRRVYIYQTSPNEKRDVDMFVQRAGDAWTVVASDMSQAVAGKRSAAVELIYGRLLPRGYVRESFAGRKAHALDAERVARLTTFVESAMQQLDVPGVSIGLVQDGRVILADGFGVRSQGREERPDANTLFMIASNTKALTTLMLAKLVDEKRLTWETPVSSVLPTFQLGNAEITRQVKVKHLICACTGLPRQDFEWLLQFEGIQPAEAMATLATVQPTSGFGELYQYSNLLAGAAGFVGGHVLFPTLELGAAYDEAMRTRVFEPLGMASTTFDYPQARRGNHAEPHGLTFDGKPGRAAMEINYSVIPLRPAGAAWSNVNDLLAYVSMELREGRLANGSRYLDRETLLERRAPQVAIGKDKTYGMGLEVDTKYGTPVVHHGGSMIGYKSDMMWLPEHGVGAVVLTNADLGWALHAAFRRRLLEVLFDGNPEADAEIAAASKSIREYLAAERKTLTIPVDGRDAAGLAAQYQNGPLGDIAVIRSGATTTFDFGEWKSEVGSRRNPDGTISFITIAPGVIGFEFVVGKASGRTLTLRDAQHEYVFVER